MKLVVITPEDLILEETTLVKQLLENGLDELHIRKPSWDAGMLRSYISRIPSEYHIRLVLHSFASLLAPEFNLKRLHFTEKERDGMSPFEFELLQEKGFRLSTSVHSVPELDACRPFFQRIFLGPVFNSISKKGYKGKTFPMFRKEPSCEVIGIGGVKNANLSTLKELGYDGGAMLGWIWENPAESLTRFLTVQKKWVLQDQLH